MVVVTGMWSWACWHWRQHRYNSSIWLVTPTWYVEELLDLSSSCMMAVATGYVGDDCDECEAEHVDIDVNKVLIVTYGWLHRPAIRIACRACDLRSALLHHTRKQTLHTCVINMYVVFLFRCVPLQQWMLGGDWNSAPTCDVGRGQHWQASCTHTYTHIILYYIILYNIYITTENQSGTYSSTVWQIGSYPALVSWCLLPPCTLTY